MAQITQVATWKSGTNSIGIQFTADGQTHTVNHVNIPKRTTNAQLEQAAATWATNHDITLPEFHVHRNRDNSFCIVFGPAPGVWPEGEAGE